MRVRFRLPCSGFAFATHKILGPFRFCMCRAWVGWSGAVAEEGPCLKESWQQGQPNAVKPEMYAGRPHGCDTTGRASAPGARSGEAPARCRPCRCAPQAWDVCGAGGPGDAPSPPTWARDVAKNSTFLVWLGPFGVSQCVSRGRDLKSEVDIWASLASPDAFPSFWRRSFIPGI